MLACTHSVAAQAARRRLPCVQQVRSSVPVRGSNVRWTVAGSGSCTSGSGRWFARSSDCGADATDSPFVTLQTCAPLRLRIRTRIDSIKFDAIIRPRRAALIVAALGMNASILGGIDTPNSIVSVYACVLFIMKETINLQLNTAHIRVARAARHRVNTPTRQRMRCSSRSTGRIAVDSMHPPNAAGPSNTTSSQMACAVAAVVVRLHARRDR